MRCLLKMELETEAANKAIADGSMADLLQELLGKLKPEAAYFTPENGSRASFIFFDLADPSDLPAITETAFQKLNAKVTITPVMNLEDLQKGLAKLG